MKLIGEKVLVRKITENITKAGIILPADKEPLLHKGEVCFVGGEVDSVSVGDIVFFAHYIKKIVDIDGVEYHTMTQGDIVAIIEQ